MHLSTQCLKVSNLQTQESPRNPEESQKQHPDWLFFFFDTTAIPRRSAAPDVCVCCVLQRSSRPLLNDKNPIVDEKFRVRRALCVHANRTICIRCRSMPHWATNVSKSRPTSMETRKSNSPPTATSSDDTSTPAQHISGFWLNPKTGPPTTGLDTPPLDGEDEDARTGTDTIVPDVDNVDIASFTSQQAAAIDTQTCDLCTRAHGPPCA